MRNNLQALNDALFEQIERIQDDQLTEEELDKEIKRSKAVTSIAQVIVANGELALRTIEHLNEYGYGKKGSPDLAVVPAMLQAGGEK